VTLLRSAVAQLLLGLLNAVVAEDLACPGGVFLATDWTFGGPVYPGDTIAAEVEVVELPADKPISRVGTTISTAPS
jgi:3-hydroxybutyryl-CoA dehydratase